MRKVRSREFAGFVYIGTAYRPPVEAYNVECERELDNAPSLVSKDVSVEGAWFQCRSNPVNLHGDQNGHGEGGGPTVLNSEAKCADNERCHAGDYAFTGGDLGHGFVTPCEFW